MTLEELLKALEQAKAASLADPSDKKLQTELAQAQRAYDDKVAEGGGTADDDEDEEEDEEQDPEFDESSADEKTKKYIAKLRKEAGSHRLKGKDLASKLQAEKARSKAILKAAGIEDDSEKPEEKIKNLTSNNESLAFRQAVLEQALEHGVPKEAVKYFQFLISEAASELEEGEELEEEKIAELALEAKASKQKKPANSTTRTDDGKGGGKSAPAPSDGKSAAATISKFVRMSISEKSELYQKNPGLYQELMSEARAKKTLV